MSGMQVDANLSFHVPLIKAQMTTNMVSMFKLAIEKHSGTDWPLGGVEFISI